MRKIQVLGIAAIAVFAFAALTASSAFAVSKLLFNNANIGANLAIAITGELLLEKLAGAIKPDIVCAGIFDGTVAAGGTTITINELLMSNGELLAAEAETIAGDDVECRDELGVCASPVLVIAGNLPWTVDVTLANALQYLAVFLAVAGKVPHYFVECVTTGGTITELCEGENSARLYTDTAGNLRAAFNSLALTEPWGAASAETTCAGTPNEGLLESTELMSTGERLDDSETAGGLVTDPSAPTEKYGLSE